MKTIHTQDKNSVNELMSQLVKPRKESHKGQNGKLLIIAGSPLFHAPMIWAAEVASKVVDMVHVTSPAEENNELMRQRLKQQFWNGIVVPWKKVEEYVEEDDCVLIGPGMERAERGDKITDDGLPMTDEGIGKNRIENLGELDMVLGQFSQDGDEREGMRTRLITNYLLEKYPRKKWVVDGGALQEVDPELLNGNMIVTPHQKEWERLLSKVPSDLSLVPRDEALITRYSLEHGGLTILLKGSTDVVVRGDKMVGIEGGNAGMTKGGTGDVLAGLTSALATTNDLFVAAQLGSLVNKQAGDELYKRQDTFFNASDLVEEIPHTMQELLR